MMESPPALVLEDVSKRFGRVQAVDRLSLQVEPGHLAGFLGPNGAGKSTTLYMVPRLVRPTHGRIRLFGVDIWKDYKKAIRSVGITVEIPAFYEYLSGRKNLELAARLLDHVSAREIDEILERIGLAERQHDRVRVYSTGMKQRLGIGRAMLGRPRLLILDEPTNGMDPAGREDILELARDLARNKGMSLLFSSHLLPDVEAVCDQVVVLGGGKLLTEGNIQHLKQLHNRCFEVRLKADAGPFAERLSALGCTAEIRDDSLLVQIPEGRSQQLLWEVAAEQRLQIRNLRPQRSTLEEVFLKALEQV